MTMRLLLALLIILSAPLATAQHLGCAQPAAVTSLPADHDHHSMASADHHEHQADMASASEPAGEDCDSCDLACLAACAAAAMPASSTDVRSDVDQAVPYLLCTSDPLLSHPLPLLRPPTHFSV